MKPRECEAPGCVKTFIPMRLGQSVCSPLCAMKKVRAAKVTERATVKARKQALKTRSDYIKEAQVIVNRYARLRDLYAGHGCISCGVMPEQKYGGSHDGGHFRSVGSAPHLRFFVSQICLQCVRCNRHLGGAMGEFRKGLITRRGLEFVEMIESMQGSPKWTIEYLQRLKKVMSKKVRRLEKRHAM